ncbi:hypothetical protein [Halobacterium noricense]|uniref:hypothetical protein n=1 Tax=Halobacterium noricense TaxID=223182 RepID=UPI001E558070|nr:hypothetical protein [Halobacterium noricense]UHH25564.1 hypothetical protein LT974_01145 [Halobacterium noricense]
MSEEVRVDEDAKSRLEELQAKIRVETGREVSHQEVLSRLIDDAYEEKDRVVAFFEATFDSDVETDEADIDGILYG